MATKAQLQRELRKVLAQGEGTKEEQARAFEYLWSVWTSEVNDNEGWNADEYEFYLDGVEGQALDTTYYGASMSEQNSLVALCVGEIDRDQYKADLEELREHEEKHDKKAGDNEGNAKKAWLMNRVIQLMNNEEAYYESGWLYSWVDESSYEEAVEDYKDDKVLAELKREYLNVFKEYYKDGWYKLGAQSDKDEIIGMINDTAKELGIKGVVKETKKDLWEIAEDKAEDEKLSKEEQLAKVLVDTFEKEDISNGPFGGESFDYKGGVVKLDDQGGIALFKFNADGSVDVDWSRYSSDVDEEDEYEVEEHAEFIKENSHFKSIRGLLYSDISLFVGLSEKVCKEAIKKTDDILKDKANDEKINDENALLKKAYEGSYFTVEGAGGDLKEWFDGLNEMFADQGIGEIKEYISFTGKDMNEWAHLTGPNAYDKNLVFFAFPLDGLNAGKLAALKMRFGARWFDDIVDNNAEREGYHPVAERMGDAGIKAKDEYVSATYRNGPVRFTFRLRDLKDMEIFEGLMGQLSDGWWENTDSMTKYWTTMYNTSDIVSVRANALRQGKWYYSPFMTVEQAKKWIAGKIKTLVKEEGLEWKRDNQEVAEWLNHHSHGSPVTVADVYSMYDWLLGRASRTPREEEEPKAIDNSLNGIFDKSRDITSLEDKFQYIKNHQRRKEGYNSLIANNVKFENLGLSEKQLKIAEMLHSDEAYAYGARNAEGKLIHEVINDVIENNTSLSWGKGAELNIGFAGRSSGWLVMEGSRNERFWAYEEYKDAAEAIRPGELDKEQIEHDFELVALFDLITEEVRHEFMSFLDEIEEQLPEEAFN